MEWYIYPAVIAAGFACGFINTLAGSGSLITLPLLIFLGLPATVANGTNRVAILLQNVVAVSSFKRQKVLDLKNGLTLAIPAILGSIFGAQIAVNLNEDIMRKTIGVLMVVMLFLILLRPKRWLEGREEDMNKRFWLKMIIFFAVGMYGGFIQAGVGFFLLASLVLGAGFDLVRANAVKNLIILCFTVFALAIFMFNDQVRWEIGLILAIGNMSGAAIAARLAVKRGAVFVRYVLIAVVIVAAIALLDIHKIVAGLF